MKAELGTLTDDDWSKTIGTLRKRAGITGGLAVKPAVADPYLQSTYFLHISDAVILEVRRERGSGWHWMLPVPRPCVVETGQADGTGVRATSQGFKKYSMPFMIFVEKAVSHEPRATSWDGEQGTLLAARSPVCRPAGRSFYKQDTFNHTTTFFKII